MRQIFISYSTEDADVAMSAVKALEARGAKCWIAPRDIPPGADWADVLPERIAKAVGLVFLLSEQSADSMNCKDEIRIARDKKVPIVTVQLDETVVTGGLDYYLGSYQFLPVATSKPDWTDTVVQAVGSFAGIAIQEVLAGDAVGTVASATKPGGPVDRNALYRDFWTRYLDQVRLEHPEWHNPKTPPSRNWLPANGPFPGTMLMPVFRSGKRVGHDLYIDTGGESENLSLYEKLRQAREEIEAAYGGPLDWLPLSGRRACRIADSVEGSIEQVDQHESMIRWFIDCGERMRRALEPVIVQIDVLPEDQREIELSDLIEGGLVSAGCTLTWHRPNGPRDLSARVTLAGSLRLPDGRAYSSPSRAARVAADDPSAVGWDVWRTEAGDALGDLRTRFLADGY